MSDETSKKETSAKPDHSFGRAEIILLSVAILLICAIILYNFISAGKTVEPVIVYAEASSSVISSSAASASSVDTATQSNESVNPEEVSGANLAAEESSAGSAESSTQAASSKVASSQESEEIGIININTASVEELDKLPGIGEVKAAAIVDYRTEYGAFDSIEEITNVSGIGDKTFEKLKAYITVE